MNQSPQALKEVQIHVPTAEDMQRLGELVAHSLQGSDVVVLSGPLGAGKTTFTQGVGVGLQIEEPVVSPTFTIARELDGQFSSGRAAHLVHVDAYRLPGSDNDDAMYMDEASSQRASDAAGASMKNLAAQQSAVNRLLDELESLGLDEILEDPEDDTVILIEWGSMMASVLAAERLEVDIDRSSSTDVYLTADDELTSNGDRLVTLRGIGDSWRTRLENLAEEF